MARSRIEADEWGQLMQKQGQINAFLDTQEKQQQREHKAAYRESLNLWQKLNEQKRQLARKEQQEDAKQVHENLKNYQKDVTREKYERALIQYDLTDVYTKQANYNAQRQQADKQQQIYLEQQHNVQVKRNISQDEQWRQSQKQEQNHYANSVIKYHNDLKSSRNQALLMEKAQDQKRAEDYMRNEVAKDQKYRDYYNRINSQQEQKQRQYVQTSAKQTNTRNGDLNAWIAKNEAEHKQRQNSKAVLEEHLRHENKSSMRNGLQYQMNDKQHERYLAQREHDRAVVEEKARSESLAEHERQEKVEKIKMQKQYGAQLRFQAELQQKQSLDQLRMNEGEKSYQKPIILAVNDASKSPLLRHTKSFDQNPIKQVQLSASSIIPSPKINQPVDETKKVQATTENPNRNQFFDQRKQIIGRSVSPANKNRLRQNLSEFDLSRTPTAVHGPPLIPNAFGRRNLVSRVDYTPKSYRQLRDANSPAGAPIRAHLNANYHNPITNPIGTNTSAAQGSPAYRGQFLKYYG